MISVTHEQELDVSLEAAWAVLADFGDFLKWATGGEGSARIEGDGIGMIRHLNIEHLGEISERLDVLNHENHTTAYTLVKGFPVGMETYSGQAVLTAAGDGSCKISWTGTLSAAEGHTDEEVSQNLAGSYAGMSQALEAFVKDNS